MSICDDIIIQSLKKVKNEKNSYQFHFRQSMKRQSSARKVSPRKIIRLTGTYTVNIAVSADVVCW